MRERERKRERERENVSSGLIERDRSERKVEMEECVTISYIYYVVPYVVPYEYKPNERCREREREGKERGRRGGMRVSSQTFVIWYLTCTCCT